MKNGRLIFESSDSMYRILEIHDEFADFDGLCGDTFNPEVNTDIDPAELEKQLRDFTDLVNREGVFGYVLEKWDPTPGKGWTHVDSCFGFVGQYSPSEDTFNHDIVEELKNRIPKEES